MASRIKQFRQHKDEYFAGGENSPLDPEDLSSFVALDYFDENPDLAFQLPIDTSATGTGDRISLNTSDGVTKEFVRAGRVTFPIGGGEAQLTVLKDIDRGRFFLPFTDATSGRETYEGGRYLDPQQSRDGTLTVDFNYAYNPYCAYSDGWSCPIPPEENALTVAIEAGEKNYLRGKPGR